MKNLITILVLFYSLSIVGQECNCQSNFKWLKTTFEENDAGFLYSINLKGEDAYQFHNKNIEEELQNVTDDEDCYNVMSDWLSFFRKGHLSLNPISTNQPKNSNSESDTEVKQKFKNWEKLEINISDFKTYLNEKKHNDYEGIWVSGDYEIGIKKINNEFIGFILKADGIYWSEKQVKLIIKADNSCIYYMKDHSAKEFEKAEMLGNNYLQMGFITLERKNKKEKDSEKLKRYIKSIHAEKPYFEKLNKNTAFLRIPNFSWHYKRDIDSVILANKKIILNTQNLIIDLRNNGGGSDGSYSELLPILYTNPIRTIGVEFLSTKLNNQRMLDIIDGKFGELSKKDKKFYQKSYDRLSKKLGEFVMMKEYPTDITTFDTIHKFPKNIGIIINENNGSTTEQFLLAAKQSKKVKLFGTTTFGVLDVSNMYFVNSPCNEYQLGYALSKSKRVPEMTIDGKGIQPDYYINKFQFEKYDWIDFVNETLNK